MANRALRAPRYSARGRRPLGAEAAGWSGSFFMPDLGEQAGQQGNVQPGPFGRR